MQRLRSWLKKTVPIGGIDVAIPKSRFGVGTETLAK